MHDGKLTREQYAELKRRIAARPVPPIVNLVEPSAVKAARKLIEKFDAKNSKHRRAQYAAHTKAKDVARNALLFGTAAQALAAVKKLETRK